MTLRKKTITIWFIITLILIVIYSSMRTEKLEEEYTKSLISTSKRIGISLNNFQKAATLKDKNLSKFSELLQKKYNNLGLVAIADRENRILNVTKNNRYFESNELFETIIRDFQDGGFKLQGSTPFLIRYYNQVKFYIFVQDAYEGKVLIMYPYILSKRAKAKLVLEILLIAICTIIIFSLSYLYLQKTGRIDAERRFRIINAGRGRLKSRVTDSKIIRDIENIASDSLYKSIYDLFHSIASNFSADIISLYILKEDKNVLEKKYELKGKAFLKIDSSDFDVIEIDNEIGQELKNSSIFVMENSKRLTFPLLFRNSLIGAVVIIREKSFIGHEMGDIKLKLEDIAKLLSEYILLNDVVVDKSTGLYSKTYFKLKYEEYKKLFMNKQGNFAVMLLSAFSREKEMEQDEYNIMMREISSKIMENLSSNDIVCRYDNHLSILMPGADKLKALNTAEKIVDALNEQKIRIGKGRQYILQPFIGYASTEQIDNGEDLLDISERSLAYAMSRSGGNVQSIRIKRILPQRT
jgi:GGDEF domain-containing protein